jgi:ubiquitin C-terminal hydrolase
MKIGEYTEIKREIFKLSGITQTKTPKCDVRGLRYQENSCWMDSVLVALFAVENRYIKENILEKDVWLIPKHPWSEKCDTREAARKMQTEFRRLMISMERKEESYCVNIRQMILDCLLSRTFGKTTQEESGEFVMYLFELFDVTNCTLHEVIHQTSILKKPFSRNDTDFVLTRTNVLASSYPVVQISPFVISQNESTTLRDLILLPDDSGELERRTELGYRRRITQTIPIKCNYLIVLAKRNDSEIGVFLTNEIIPDQDLYLPLQSEDPSIRLTLHAIVVWRGTYIISEKINQGHWTTYLKCKDLWYYYDDMADKLKEVGDYNALLGHPPDLSRFGVLFFYTR